MKREDLDAILQDVEDICARLPRNEDIKFTPTFRFTSRSQLAETYIAFDCRRGRYTLTTVTEGVARTTRFASRTSLLDRIYPEEEEEEENIPTEEEEGEEEENTRSRGFLSGLLGF